MCNSTHTRKKKPISQLIKTVLVTLARNLKAVGSSEKKTTKHHLFGSSAKITKQKQERKTMTRKESKIAQGKKKSANAEELSICFLQASVFFLSFFLAILSHFIWWRQLLTIVISFYRKTKRLHEIM